MKQAAVCTKKLWLVASIGGLQLLGGKSDSLGGGGGGGGVSPAHTRLLSFHYVCLLF